VSDAGLEDVRVEDGRLRLGGGSYRALALPPTRFLSPAAARRLTALVTQGATLILVGGPPADVPGYAALEARRQELRDALAPLGVGGGAAASRASNAGGRVLAGDDAETLLAAAAVPRETLTDAGLQFVRRRRADGRDYFVVNRGEAAFDGWLPLATRARAAVLLDPLAAGRTGTAALRVRQDGTAEVRAQLEPGASIVVRTLETREIEAPAWPYADPAGPPLPVDGVWSVSFVEGGPALPAAFETRTLASWTSLGDGEARRFAGTARYEIRFERPRGSAPDWQLDLGDVRESARVRLNGQSLGTLWSRPFRTRLGRALRSGSNRLEVEVTNLAANRIRELDLRGVAWKRFHDINVVGMDYKPFDASGWPLTDSGLLGPVTLTPLRAEATAASGVKAGGPR
jgi:hypothetical protein